MRTRTCSIRSYPILVTIVPFIIQFLRAQRIIGRGLRNTINQKLLDDPCQVRFNHFRVSMRISSSSPYHSIHAPGIMKSPKKADKHLIRIRISTTASAVRADGEVVLEDVVRFEAGVNVLFLN